MDKGKKGNSEFEVLKAALEQAKKPNAPWVDDLARSYVYGPRSAPPKPNKPDK